MSKLCLVDFDETLITVDSLKTVMKRERWYLSPELLMAGAGIVASKLHSKFVPGQSDADRLRARSRFKLILLRKFRELPADRRIEYTEFFKKHINHDLTEEIRAAGYDRIVVISASETGLIREVLSDVLPDCEVIANECPDTQESAAEFRTCYGAEKVVRLRIAIPDYAGYDITVYTDSYSDRPLMDIAGTTHMVK